MIPFEPEEAFDDPDPDTGLLSWNPPSCCKLAQASSIEFPEIPADVLSMPLLTAASL